MVNKVFRRKKVLEMFEIGNSTLQDWLTAGLSDRSRLGEPISG